MLMKTASKGLVCPAGCKKILLHILQEGPCGLAGIAVRHKTAEVDDADLGGRTGEGILAGPEQEGKNQNRKRKETNLHNFDLIEKQRGKIPAASDLMCRFCSHTLFQDPTQAISDTSGQSGSTQSA